MTDVADGRYLVESGTDLVNHTTMGGLTVVGFDGRFAVIAPCADSDAGTCDDPAAWTVLDVSGRQPPVKVPGPVVLLRPQRTGGSLVDVEATPVQRGDRGPWVTFLQQQLVARGASIDVDGTFGPSTEDAVRRLQAAAGIDVDGIADRTTWGVLSDVETVVATTMILRPDGLGPVDFGTDADDAVDALTALVGLPDDEVTVDAGDEPGCVEGAGWLDCARASALIAQGRLLTWTGTGLQVLLTDGPMRSSARNRRCGGTRRAAPVPSRASDRAGR